MQQDLTFKWLAGLLLVFLVYSSANIFMKLSSSGDNLIATLFFLICAFGVLGIYAILWQQILKHISLTTAFMFKSVTVIYGMAFAFFLFKEQISANNIAGACMIIVGIIILGWKS